MYWTDEGYLLSKNNFNENSIIIEAFTLEHGKHTGIVFGGSSRKQKKIFQIGNKILLNWNSKNENRYGYFSVELIEAISPLYFDDKKRSICILSATAILKLLLPERQVNEKIYKSFEKMISKIKCADWLNLYLLWELSLIKELGYEINISSEDEENYENRTLEVNDKTLKIPRLFSHKAHKNNHKNDIIEALTFNKHLIMENFIIPNKLKFPFFRDMLEIYCS
tara:strand:- start:206 stop:874 length:669 start_codon:yes stop_codon:yes gene_type:complete